MSRRSRRVAAPPRPRIRHKAKDERAFEVLFDGLKQEQLSQKDVHKLLEFLYARYDGEIRYYNRLRKDDGKMIV